MRARTQRMRTGLNETETSQSGCDQDDDEDVYQNSDSNEQDKTVYRRTAAGNAGTPIQQVYSERKKYYDTVIPPASDTEENAVNTHLSNTPYHLPSTALLDIHDEVQTEDTAHIEESKRRLQ